MDENESLESTKKYDDQLIERFKSIKERDQKLTTRLRSALWLAHPFGGSQIETQNFANDVQQLVNDMAGIADGTFNREPVDYYWLEDAAARWKFICETAVGVSIALPIFGGKITLISLDNREINRFVQFKAHKISESRRHAKAVKKLEEIMRAHFQETTPAEESWDWLQAEQYFAKDMIYGTGDLFRYVELGNIRSSDIWKYLHHDTFDRLENVWLSDVFQLRAYEIWLEKGSVVTSDRTAIDMDFRNACSQFTERMLNDAIKYPEEARGTLEGYLQEKLKLGKGPIFEDQEPFLTLINKKATRIKELSGHGDRSRAQQYVLDFYRPLYGAVVTEDEKAKKNVAAAFKIGEGADEKCPIASCFDALVMAYYVRGTR